MCSLPRHGVIWGLLALCWSGCATHAAPKQSLGTVLSVADASYVVGMPAIGMRASSKRKVPMVEVQVRLDGVPEPLSYSSRTGSALRRLVAGQRVRVTYREQGGLFGSEIAVIRIAAEGESP